MKNICIYTQTRNEDYFNGGSLVRESKARAQTKASLICLHLKNLTFILSIIFLHPIFSSFITSLSRQPVDGPP